MTSAGQTRRKGRRGGSTGNRAKGERDRRRGGDESEERRRLDSFKVSRLKSEEVRSSPELEGGARERGREIGERESCRRRSVNGNPLWHPMS